MSKKVISEHTNKDNLEALAYCGISDEYLGGVRWYSRFTVDGCKERVIRNQVARFRELLKEK